ncbi:Uncharacterized protein PHPALM_1351 [Phytophthora palmivora]|uniref:Uncharacterized protein n=1 Tax=Phytophthora palmivora TaxID=4796 RepID=A0A2P4YSJ8_9STRA|nr:Uncharacterized protein PHPALM_1351 [Phytophthora palmivora]
MKIAWLLIWTWASSDVAAQLRFATEESLDEIQEDETYKLTSVQLETSPGVPLINNGATWSQTYYQLLISCDHGTLQLDRDVGQRLVDTTFLCVGRFGDLHQGRSIGVFTTAWEAQQILSSIVYQPDTNYHSTWYGVTDPLCTTGHVSNEIVRMQLLPVNGDLPVPSDASCVTVDLGGNSSFETGSAHEKKISVSSVNDPPIIEMQPSRNLSVVTGGSCTGLDGFKLGDAEADAIENGSKAMVPILTLQLSVTFGELRSRSI